MKTRVKKFFALTWFLALFGLALIKAQGCRAATPVEEESVVESVEQEDQGRGEEEVDLGVAEEEAMADDGGDFDAPPGFIPATKFGPVMQQQSSP